MREGERASMAKANPEALLPPGFRFHPTDEELILHYLRNQATSMPSPVSIIAEVDIYKFDPWDLPAKAAFGDREWYFFSPRERKYPNGVRPNRAAASGYWKATGTDKPIVAGGPRKENIGVKKALVFYQGRPPKGLKTDWIMHEYRLPTISSSYDHPARPRDSSMRLDDWVLCRIYKKSNNQPSCSSDRDCEDSSSEDAFFVSSGDGAGAGTPQNDAKLPKSASLTDLFNDVDFSVLTGLLHENPSDMAGPELGQLPGQTSLTLPFTGLGYDTAAGFSVLPKMAPMELPGPVAGGCFKRQRVTATTDYGGAGGEAAPPLYNIRNQPFLQQQMMLNSRFGLP